ncbi:multicopper oxidase domain-containing protein [Algoriphagus algorifonticola]|uniref:multicopper oxidase domain-containing protein n=1 Tax=Algoriphagus algorifonticola TaxID=2593007 RepID=UPI0011A686CD|nr:multicopper oxidase domain-containing protein [Algoriphagus algorifonticola]
MNLRFYYILTISFSLLSLSTRAQNLTEKSVEGNVDNLPVREYTITLKQEMVNKAGKDVKGMTVNGSIPGPTLRFTEGEYAVIYVKNEMDVETSVHWHGLLLPNFYDGVPYLTTPPIEPGHTQKYEFPLKQSGTYWYHSHTMLQEQSGVYGSIVIQPKEEPLEYDKELVMVLSDWTNENPMSVLRFLKRGTEWYNWRKGTATPLNQVIARGALGAQLNFWRQRMESADIADIYYPAFLVNGEQKQEYPDFKPGEKVRLRIINGAASTQFWMTFGGGNPTIVSADGLNVEPVAHNKTFIAIAETYDFIVTIPEEGKMEFKITAQDGSGTASAFLGQGEMLPAPAVPRPDKIAMMKQMSKMDMRMGAPALKFRPKKVDPEKMMRNWGMQMKDGMSGMNMDNTKSDISMHQGMDMKKDDPEETKMSGMGDDKMMQTSPPSTNMESAEMGGMNMFSEYNYDYLKSTENTTYSEDVPVKEILLNLTGNMSRYIWSMNGIPLSETDKIKINEGEVTRITFNNLTMMHHPMHLHGHFFRVINENGDYSPLKHTVNVPPMQKVTIEFYGNEYGDWFFHCHILYHMMGGMARVVSYDTPEDPRMKPFPISKLIHETNRFYSWGMADVASHNTTVNLTTSNIRNQFNLSMEYGWNQNLEAEFSYEYYLYDYLRVFGGVNVENTTRNSLDEMKTIAVAGIRWFTPYMFSVDLRVDNELRPRIGIGRSLMVFPKLSVFGYYEYQIDAGWVNSLEAGQDYKEEIVWSAGAQYMLSKNFSLMTSYDNRFGAGAGLSVMF